MSSPYWFRNTVTIILIGVLFISGTDAVRRFHRRSDLDNVPLISASGYVVPTEGLSGTLPQPHPDKALTILALGRGTITYGCSGKQRSEAPSYISQSTSLWDAAPLIPRIPDENQFHTIIPQLYDFDYSQLANSTLSCIGTIETSQGCPVISFFNGDKIAADIQATVEAPIAPDFNLPWAYESSADLKWEIYRVETAGGLPTSNCQASDSVIKVDYAAEYWFYRG